MMKYLITLSVLLLSGLAWALPSTTSGLNGFEGIKIENIDSDMCNLVFPKEYGLKYEQLQNLIAMSNDAIEHDIGCMAPAAFHSLKHIRMLAIDFQNDSAADLILKEKFNNLGVSISEEFTDEYQIPVLKGYKGSSQYFKLNPSLPKKLSNLLVNTLCNEWAYNPEKIELLVSDLGKNNIGDMAKDFKKACDDEIRKIPYFK